LIFIEGSSRIVNQDDRPAHIDQLKTFGIAMIVLDFAPVS
jgi:hypothetical protein